MSKSIGIYGGTFDPFHLGHLNLAMEIFEKRMLDEVWFCPAQVSPHKLEEQPPVAAHHRLNMLKLAIKDIPYFRVLDVELFRETPSYTVDTLRDLIRQKQTQLNPALFYLILGDDSLSSFFQWHQPEEIVQLAPLLIGNRLANFTPEYFSGDSAICLSIQKGWTPTRLMEISATDIRSRLRARKYCGHLMQKEILDYIYANQLYFL
jgi:nicotinate-nucleotide adenylyltransferase